MKFTTHLYDEATDAEYEVEVEYTYHPPYRGRRDSLGGIRGAGPPLEPDEDAEVEIQYVTLVDNGADITERLTEEEYDYLWQQCWYDYEGMRQAAAEVRYDEEKERRVLGY